MRIYIDNEILKVISFCKFDILTIDVWGAYPQTPERSNFSIFRKAQNFQNSTF